jgi:hypothetical protein
MTKEELGELAMEILNGAEVDKNFGEDGVIQVNSDLLFRYYVMRGNIRRKAKKAEKTVA